MEFIIKIEQFFVTTYETIEIIAMIVMGSATLTALLPNESDNKFIQFLLDMLNVLGVNVHRNRNECDDSFAVREARHERRAVERKLGGRDT